MSNDIKPGDWVVVCKPTPCCASDKYLGTVYQVGTFRQFYGLCNACGRTADLTIATDIESAAGAGNPLPVLKKIKPLSDEDKGLDLYSIDLPQKVPA